MTDKKAIKDFVEGYLAGTPYFLVDVTVSADNDIAILIEHPDSVDIEYCMELSRAFEQAFSRDEEDYSLEVGSAGLTAPLQVLGQYLKNVGHKIEVLTRDGRKLRGTLLSADEQGFTLRSELKVKPIGAKRPILQEHEEHLTYEIVKKAVPMLEF